MSVIRLPALYAEGIGPALNGAVRLPTTAGPHIIAHLFDAEDE